MLFSISTFKRSTFLILLSEINLDKVIDLTIDRKDFIDTLEKNIHIHAYHEEYERCAEIRDVIQKLKNK